MKWVAIENQTQPLARPVWAGYCDSFFCQLRGFTFRKKIGDEEALLLVQGRDSRLDSSIHMLFVWTDLAVVWMDSRLDVVDVRRAKRWRPGYVPARPARYVLELAPGRFDEFKVGDRLAIVEARLA